MCFCDGFDFLVINKTNGEKHFIQGDENLVGFFEGHYSLPCLFHRVLKKEYVRHNATFTISRTTPTRNVNESKWNLLKRWGLKTLNYGNVPKNIYIYSIQKKTINIV